MQVAPDTVWSFYLNISGDVMVLINEKSQMRTALLEIFDRNGFIHLSIVAIVITCCMIYGLLYAFLYPTILILLELLNYVGGLQIFNPEKRIQRGYVVSAFFNDSLFDQGIDYGFNFYNGDYSKSRVKAQSDKFEYACKQLNLEPGMWVIDIGCGCGDLDGLFTFKRFSYLAFTKGETYSDRK